MEIYLVKYSGLFGFIKPWTAVRDELTFSQQFLTESMIFGIERKLFPELLKEPYGIQKITGYRLTYDAIGEQQEKVQTRGYNIKGTKNRKLYERPTSILKRGVLINPVLYLVFDNEEDAQQAATQHLCLTRNEDILYPEGEIMRTTVDDFNSSEEYSGFELVFEKNESSFLTGYNRFNEASPMYGWLRIVGTPIKEFYD
ncbi:hypothetical protein [Algivirga pacifica]|uniref:Uncharacterized protein n=1 Tax=Algivirga pacifica TaxID=1162670 RepID=A0ABP9DIZ3_9BACT